MITFGSVSVDLSDIISASATFVGAVTALIATIYSHKKRSPSRSKDNKQEDAT